MVHGVGGNVDGLSGRNNHLGLAIYNDSRAAFNDVDKFVTEMKVFFNREASGSVAKKATTQAILVCGDMAAL